MESISRHSLKTAISTGGFLSQQNAKDMAFLLERPYFAMAQWGDALDDQDACVGPIDAPEYIPSGGSACENDCGCIHREH